MSNSIWSIEGVLPLQPSPATLLSPVRLPAPEILAEISGPASHGLQDYHKEGILKAVMLPAHVYKHWRGCCSVNTDSLDKYCPACHQWNIRVPSSSSDRLVFFRSGAISPSKDERMSSRSWLFFFQHCRSLENILMFVHNLIYFVPWSRRGKFSAVGDDTDRYHG